MKNTLSSLGFNAVMSASAFALTMGMAATASAQVTTSEVQGYVTNTNGNPIPGASVTLTNNATGLSRSLTTDSVGAFAARNLPVGGTYNVTVSADNYTGERVEDISLSLGGSANLNFALEGGSVTDEIIVVAQRNVLAEVAVGPSANFGLDTIQSAPAINRNITDILRLDPRIYVDESRGDINAVQCAGQSSRFNSLTLDGVRMNDSFGLNSNGYPTERQPFSFDAIEQVSVELAPFDVEYGGFTACQINAVTKSGTNEIHGGAFIDYTDDGLRGDRVGDRDVEFGEFDEIRYGFNVGGPIIKDKLFFFTSYEKLEGANLYNEQPIGNGSFQITQAQLDDIINIAQTQYQYDPGTLPISNPNEDEKVLVKLDWNITDNHRASFVYNYNDGFNTVRSDGDSNEVEFSNHLYERGSKLNSYTGSLYSDWTENFSTELRFNYLDLDARANPIGGTDFGEFRVSVGDVDVYLGADDSRHANVLEYEVITMAAKADYITGNHTFSGGIEREELDVFNLFVQHTETEIRFDGIENFRNGFADAIYYNNAPSNNPADAAAVWGYATNTIYGQDEYDFQNGLKVVAGLRYDFYTTDDAPEENADFVADYGFSNSTNLDGEGLLQPRLGFTYDASSELQLFGGAGLYSGGNPNVWLSNNFSANNVLQFGQRGRSFGYTDGSRSLFDADVVYSGLEDGVPAGPGYGVPSELFDAVASGVGDNFEINYLDPDFDIPSEWKAAAGFTWSPSFDTGEDLFGGIWTFTADAQYSRSNNQAIVLRADLEAVGTTADGYTDYDSVREPAFVLTNADEEANSYAFSLGLNRQWENHAITAGYAYTDANDIQPMTSSVAFSNYTNRAFNDPQEQVASTSNYNIKHRFTASYRYEKEFIADYASKAFVFFQHSSGRPYSRTISGNSAFNFTPFLEGNNVLVPGTERNEFTGPSWTKVDLKLTQELPGLRADDRATVFMVIDNLTNMINSDWGQLDQPSFPRGLLVGQPFSTSTDASAYEVRFGATYDF